MQPFNGDSDELWPDRHEIDLDALRASSNHDDYMGHAVELLKEVGVLTTLVAGTGVDDAPLARNDAIQRGMLVRLSKLANSLLNETCAGHGEQQLALSRQVLETVMNIIYLLGAGDEGYDAFVYDALVAEKELEELIRNNVEERGGTTLPIEDRMLRSIGSTATAAGVDLETLPSKSKNKWPNVLERMRVLGFEDVYVLFRLGSSAIHGGWSELYLHHLEEAGGGLFNPRFDHLPPRPEALTACGVAALGALGEYVSRQDPRIDDLFRPRLDDLRARIVEFDAVHERFVQDRQ